MLRIGFFIVFTLALFSCTGGDINKNLEELDKVYGYCDNPHRQFNKVQYKICKDKERAGSNQEAFSISNFLNNRAKNDESLVYVSAVNQELWNSSISVLQDYAFKIADNEGGYIETDWIYEGADRCLIKIHINSNELISTGVSANIVCQKLIDDSWTNDNIDYVEEEKSLTLKILELASINSQVK